MIDSDSSESKSGINIWISITDLFAGLLLISLMGIVVLINQLHHLRVEHENLKHEVRFSRALLNAMHQATDTTHLIQAQLEKTLPNLPEYSETEITIPSVALFGQLEFEVSSNQEKELLYKIRKAIHEALAQTGEKQKFLRVVIEGHTDSDNIRPENQTKEIPTNWELSSRRATGVLRLFAGQEREEVDPESAIPATKLMAVGLADTHPATLDPNKKAENRRIVIRIEPDFNEINKILLAE